MGITVWAYDFDGSITKEHFNNEKEALGWARNYGLEIFKMKEGKH